MPGLWTAFAARNGTGDLLVASSPDGVNWTDNTKLNARSFATPSLAGYNNGTSTSSTARSSTQQHRTKYALPPAPTK